MFLHHKNRAAMRLTEARAWFRCGIKVPFLSIRFACHNHPPPHSPVGKASGTSPLSQAAVRSSGSTARVSSKCSTASNRRGTRCARVVVCPQPADKVKDISIPPHPGGKTPVSGCATVSSCPLRVASDMTLSLFLIQYGTGRLAYAPPVRASHTPRHRWLAQSPRTTGPRHRTVLESRYTPPRPPPFPAHDTRYWRQ